MPTVDPTVPGQTEPGQTEPSIDLSEWLPRAGRGGLRFLPAAPFGVGLHRVGEQRAWYNALRDVEHYLDRRGRE